ncbi:pilus assembly protein CpaD [Bradyrhizobium sacchari]|uniref:Pilus assembly protein CpaD n=2 Tax=Bradyrhizobium sacchari TaxID=1399419 RepID=A0A560JEN2_9BRAD|nr:pilus assembly protein CpaD [Bradyrhizobium sacchari]TWB69495.1 pilus assembly protein CpaD [Bradyrhizobium sacchari]
MFLQSLRAPEKLQLRSFIANVSGGRRDALHVDVSGSPKLIAQVAHEARAMGVDPYNIRLSASPLNLPGRSGVRIEAITFEAHLPNCPSLSIVGPAVNDNSFEPTLGCSTKNNLAVMVNDPLDMVDNRSVTTVNGDRAVAPLANHTTLAPRNKSNGEEGAAAVASDAAGTTTQNVQPLR